MTADPDLLPLPERSQLANPYQSRGALTYGHDDNAMHAYARANVAHATAAKDAEIEALRARLAVAYRVKAECNDEANRQRERAERLAEALWALVAKLWHDQGMSRIECATELEALLRDQALVK